ncbi:unnamed protein product [Owenia fusiformis]|uniref:ShKT domain-containing protein n=1 Tax=Owenia fusiformis TaxID=6347 RepID=A0A8S4PV03_OWEFU|nr:unnamed protein product [Owenia fusiformis]
MHFGNPTTMEGLTWTLAVCTLLVIGSSAEAVATGCEDIRSIRCESFKERNNLNCNFRYEKKYCKKTCNLCNEKTGSSLDQLQTIAEEKRQGSEGCKDTLPSYCEEGKKYDYMTCESSFDKRSCKKTCNLCKPETGCRDISNLCKYYTADGSLNCTLSGHGVDCRKSCNLCDDNGGTETGSQIIADAEKRQESEDCRDIMPDCLRQNNEDGLDCGKSHVQLICKKFCKLCPGDAGIATACRDRDSKCGLYKQRGLLNCANSMERYKCMNTCNACDVIGGTD